MDHIRIIQEVIDEHKEAAPTEVVRVVMKNAQCLYDVHKSLYKLTWTTVDSHAHVAHVEDEEDFASVKLSHKTQTLIVEAVDEPPDRERPYSGKMSTLEMPHQGLVIKSWIGITMPHAILNPVDWSSMVILHSIVPYEPRKRVRDTDGA